MRVFLPDLRVIRAKRPWPLLFVLVVAAGSSFPGRPSPAQQAPAVPTPAYDVASIRPNHSDNSDRSTQWNNGNFTATNASLKSLLANAYGIRDGLISGLPGWAESARYDIRAKIVDPDLDALKKLSPEQFEAMLAALLADRFHLQAHRETRMLPVFDLLVAKGRLKIQELPAGSRNSESAPRKGGVAPGSIHSTDTEMISNAISAQLLSEWLSGQLKRTVIDKTSLSGVYDFHLKWADERTAMAGPYGGQPRNSGDTGPSIFTALQDQLGLKLESAKGPVVTLVVDHVDPPSEN